MLSYADYLLTLTPPQSIIDSIGKYKRASVNTIGHFEGMHNKACIVITHQARRKPFLAQAVFMQMERNLNTMPPIDLKLNGFAYFNKTRFTKTIYGVIEPSGQTDKWFRLLKLQMGIKIKNYVPRILVVEDIPLPDFNKLWPNFKNQVINETFKVNSLTLLHRETFSLYYEWRVYKELHFANRLNEMF